MTIIVLIGIKSKTGKGVIGYVYSGDNNEYVKKLEKK